LIYLLSYIHVTLQLFIIAATSQKLGLLVRSMHGLELPFNYSVTMYG